MSSKSSRGITREQFKVFSLSAIGGALEFYDFIIFVFLATILSKLFFDSSSPHTALLLSFMIFASGYFARVVGGLFFAHVGDRQGRKKSFAMTIFLMAVPTFCMGLLPTYEQIGWMATALLLVLRIMQGLAIGGEIPSATAFIYEHASHHNRGLGISALFTGLIFGIVMGSGMGALVTWFFDDATLHSWGWRIPFLLGGVLGFFGVYLRSYLHETPAFQQIATESEKAPLWIAVRHYGWSLVRGTAVVWAIAGGIIVYFLYLPTYLDVTYGFPLDDVLFFNTMATLLYAVSIIAFGMAADRWKALPVLRFGLVALGLGSLALFPFISAENIYSSCLVYLAPIIGHGGVTAAGMLWLAEQFPTKIRTSGISIAYNLGFGIFGGVSPALLTWLLGFSGAWFNPGIYVGFVCVLALVFLGLGRRNLAHRTLR